MRNKHTHNIWKKVIAAGVACLFLADQLVSLPAGQAGLWVGQAWAYPDTLAPPLGEKKTYEQMLKKMEEALGWEDADHQKNIDGPYAEKYDKRLEKIHPVEEEFPGLIAGVVKTLREELGRYDCVVAQRIADKIETLAKYKDGDKLPNGNTVKKAAINLVEEDVDEILLPHSGGFGINIPYREGMDASEVARRLLHEAIAGCVFGDRSRVHALADVVVQELDNGDFENAARLLSQVISSPFPELPKSPALSRRDLSNYLLTKYGSRQILRGLPTSEPHFFRRIKVAADRDSDAFIFRNAQIGPEFLDARDEKTLDELLQDLLTDDADFEIVLKPEFFIMGQGMVFLNRTKSDGLTITVGYRREKGPETQKEHIVGNYLTQLGVKGVKDLPGQNIEQLRLREDKVGKEEIIELLRRLWKAIADDAPGKSFLGGIAESRMDYIKKDGMAYSTRLFIKGNLSTGEASGIDREKWEGTVGSSEYLSNSTGRKEQGARGLNKDEVFEPLYTGGYVTSSKQDFEDYVERCLGRIFEHFCNRLKAAGIIIEEDAVMRFDIAWLDAGAGQHPIPVVIDSILFYLAWRLAEDWPIEVAPLDRRLKSLGPSDLLLGDKAVWEMTEPERAEVEGHRDWAAEPKPPQKIMTEVTSMATVGARLKRLREYRGLSQRGLEIKSGVAQHTISAIESGKTEKILGKTRKSLAEALGVNERVFIIEGSRRPIEEVLPEIMGLKTLGERVKKAREYRGLTLRQLEELSGVSMSTISNLERNRPVSEAQFERVARALKMDKEVFIAEEAEPHRPLVAVGVGPHVLAEVERLKTRGERVEALLKHNGWMQKDLAKVAGLHPKSIQRAVANKRVSRETVNSIAGAFGVEEGLLHPRDTEKIPDGVMAKVMEEATVKARVERLCEFREWNIVYLSRRSEVSFGTLSGFLEGKTMTLRQKNLEKLAKALQVPTKVLVVDTPKKPLEEFLDEIKQLPTIGDRLKAVRDYRGLSLTQLQDKTGIKRETIHSLEKNKIPHKEDRLKKLARGLDINEEVFGIDTGKAGARRVYEPGALLQSKKYLERAERNFRQGHYKTAKRQYEVALSLADKVEDEDGEGSGIVEKASARIEDCDNRISEELPSLPKGDEMTEEEALFLLDKEIARINNVWVSGANNNLVAEEFERMNAELAGYGEVLLEAMLEGKLPVEKRILRLSLEPIREEMAKRVSAFIKSLQEPGAGVTQAGVLPHRGTGYVNECITRSLAYNLEEIAEWLNISKRDYRQYYEGFAKWFSGREEMGLPVDEVPDDVRIPIEKLASPDDYVYVVDDNGALIRRLKIVRIPVEELGRVNGVPFYGHIGFREGVIWLADKRDKADVAATCMHEAKEYKRAYRQARSRGWDMEKMADWRDGKVSEYGGFKGALEFFSRAHLLAWKDTVEAFESQYEEEDAKPVPINEVRRKERQKRLAQLQAQLGFAKRWLARARRAMPTAISKEAGAGVISKKDAPEKFAQSGIGVTASESREDEWVRLRTLAESNHGYRLKVGNTIEYYSIAINLPNTSAGERQPIFSAVRRFRGDVFCVPDEAMGEGARFRYFEQAGDLFFSQTVFRGMGIAGLLSLIKNIQDALERDDMAAVLKLEQPVPDLAAADSGETAEAQEVTVEAQEEVGSAVLETVLETPAGEDVTDKGVVGTAGPGQASASQARALETEAMDRWQGEPGFAISPALRSLIEPLLNPETEPKARNPRTMSGWAQAIEELKGYFDKAKKRNYPPPTELERRAYEMVCNAMVKEWPRINSAIAQLDSKKGGFRDKRLAEYTFGLLCLTFVSTLWRAIEGLAIDEAEPRKTGQRSFCADEQPIEEFFNFVRYNHLVSCHDSDYRDAPYFPSLGFITEEESEGADPAAPVGLKSISAARCVGAETLLRSFPDIAAEIASGNVLSTEYVKPAEGNPPALALHCKDPVKDMMGNILGRSITVFLLDIYWGDVADEEAEDDLARIEKDRACVNFDEAKVRGLVIEEGMPAAEKLKRLKTLFDLAIDNLLVARSGATTRSFAGARRMANFHGRTPGERLASYYQMRAHVNKGFYDLELKQQLKDLLPANEDTRKALLRRFDELTGEDLMRVYAVQVSPEDPDVAAALRGLLDRAARNMKVKKLITGRPELDIFADDWLRDEANRPDLARLKGIGKPIKLSDIIKAVEAWGKARRAEGERAAHAAEALIASLANVDVSDGAAVSAALDYAENAAVGLGPKDTARLQKAREELTQRRRLYLEEQEDAIQAAETLIETLSALDVSEDAAVSEGLDKSLEAPAILPFDIADRLRKARADLESRRRDYRERQAEATRAAEAQITALGGIDVANSTSVRKLLDETSTIPANLPADIADRLRKARMGMAGRFIARVLVDAGNAYETFSGNPDELAGGLATASLLAGEYETLRHLQPDIDSAQSRIGLMKTCRSIGYPILIKGPAQLAEVRGRFAQGETAIENIEAAGDLTDVETGVIERLGEAMIALKDDVIAQVRGTLRDTYSNVESGEADWTDLSAMLTLYAATIEILDEFNVVLPEEKTLLRGDMTNLRRAIEAEAREHAGLEPSGKRKKRVQIRKHQGVRFTHKHSGSFIDIIYGGKLEERGEGVTVAKIDIGCPVGFVPFIGGDLAASQRIHGGWRNNDNLNERIREHTARVTDKPYLWSPIWTRAGLRTVSGKSEIDNTVWLFGYGVANSLMTDEDYTLEEFPNLVADLQVVLQSASEDSIRLSVNDYLDLFEGPENFSADSLPGHELIVTGRQLTQHQDEVLRQAQRRLFEDGIMQNYRLSPGNETYSRLDPNGELADLNIIEGRGPGADIYIISDRVLFEHLTQIDPAEASAIMEILISHAGTFRDEAGQARAQNVFVLESRAAQLLDLAEPLRLRWASHEAAHIRNIQLDESAVQEQAPISELLDEFERIAEREESAPYLGEPAQRATPMAIPKEAGAGVVSSTDEQDDQPRDTMLSRGILVPAMLDTGEDAEGTRGFIKGELKEAIRDGIVIPLGRVMLDGRRLKYPKPVYSKEIQKQCAYWKTRLRRKSLENIFLISVVDPSKSDGDSIHGRSLHTNRFKRRKPEYVIKGSGLDKLAYREDTGYSYTFQKQGEGENEKFWGGMDEDELYASMEASTAIRRYYLADLRKPWEERDPAIRIAEFFGADIKTLLRPVAGFKPLYLPRSKDGKTEFHRAETILKEAGVHKDFIDIRRLYLYRALVPTRNLELPGINYTQAYNSSEWAPYFEYEGLDRSAEEDHYEVFFRAVASYALFVHILHKGLGRVFYDRQTGGIFSADSNANPAGVVFDTDTVKKPDLSHLKTTELAVALAARHSKELDLVKWGGIQPLAKQLQLHRSAVEAGIYLFNEIYNARECDVPAFLDRAESHFSTKEELSLNSSLSEFIVRKKELGETYQATQFVQEKTTHGVSVVQTDTALAHSKKSKTEVSAANANTALAGTMDKPTEQQTKVHIFEVGDKGACSALRKWVKQFAYEVGFGGEYATALPGHPQGYTTSVDNGLSIAVLELAYNAIKAGSRTLPTVSVQEIEEGGRKGIEIIVEDREEGIPNIEQYLMPSFSTAEDEEDGKGLGLATARDFTVYGGQGTFTVESSGQKVVYNETGVVQRGRSGIVAGTRITAKRFLKKTGAKQTVEDAPDEKPGGGISKGEESFKVFQRMLDEALEKGLPDSGHFSELSKEENERLERDLIKVANKANSAEFGSLTLAEVIAEKRNDKNYRVIKMPLITVAGEPADYIVDIDSHHPRITDEMRSKIKQVFGTDKVLFISQAIFETNDFSIRQEAIAHAFSCTELGHDGAIDEQAKVWLENRVDASDRKGDLGRHLSRLLKSRPELLAEEAEELQAQTKAQPPFPQLLGSEGLTLSNLLSAFRRKDVRRVLADGGPIMQPPVFTTLESEPDIPAEKDVRRPEFNSPNHVRRFDDVLEQILAAEEAEITLPLVLKPLAGALALGVCMITSDEPGKITLTVSLGEGRLGGEEAYNFLERIGLPNVVVNGPENIAQVTLDTKTDDVRGILRRLREEISKYAVPGAIDPCMVETMVQGIRGRSDQAPDPNKLYAYETKHNIEGNLLTGEAELLTDMWFGWVGRSELFSVWGAKRLKAFEIFDAIYEDQQCVPKEIREDEDAFREYRIRFREHVKKAILAEFKYFSDRVKEAGIILDATVRCRIDLGWLPPKEKGGFPRPYITEMGNFQFEGGLLNQTLYVASSGVPRGSQPTPTQFAEANYYLNRLDKAQLSRLPQDANRITQNFLAAGMLGGEDGGLAPSQTAQELAGYLHLHKSGKSPTSADAQAAAERYVSGLNLQLALAEEEAPKGEDAGGSSSSTVGPADEDEVHITSAQLLRTYFPSRKGLRAIDVGAGWQEFIGKLAVLSEGLITEAFELEVRDLVNLRGELLRFQGPSTSGKIFGRWETIEKGQRSALEIAADANYRGTFDIVSLNAPEFGASEALVEEVANLLTPDGVVLLRFAKNDPEEQRKEFLDILKEAGFEIEKEFTKLPTDFPPTGWAKHPPLYVLKRKAEGSILAKARQPQQAEPTGSAGPTGSPESAGPARPTGLAEPARLPDPPQRQQWAKSLVDSVRAEAKKLGQQKKRLAIAIDTSIGNLEEHGYELIGALEELAEEEGLKDVLDVITGDGPKLRRDTHTYLQKNKNAIVRGIVRAEDSEHCNTLFGNYKERIRLVAVDDRKTQNRDTKECYYIPLMPIIRSSLTGGLEPIPYASQRKLTGYDIITSIITLEPVEPITMEELEGRLREDAIFVGNA